MPTEENNNGSNNDDDDDDDIKMKLESTSIACSREGEDNLKY